MIANLGIDLKTCWHLRQSHFQWIKVSIPVFPTYETPNMMQAFANAKGKPELGQSLSFKYHHISSKYI